MSQQAITVRHTAHRSEAFSKKTAKTSHVRSKPRFPNTKNGKHTFIQNYSEEKTPTVIPLFIKTVFHNPSHIGHAESTCNHEAKELLKAALSTGKLLVSSGNGGIALHLQAVMSLGYCHCCVNEASHHL